MGKLKFAELVVLSIASLATIAKSIVKFIGYLDSLFKKQPATSTG